MREQSGMWEHKERVLPNQNLQIKKLLKKDEQRKITEEGDKKTENTLQLTK